MHFDVENPLLLVPRLSVPPAAVVHFPGPSGAVSPTYRTAPKNCAVPFGAPSLKPPGEGGIACLGQASGPP